MMFDTNNTIVKMKNLINNLIEKKHIMIIILKIHIFKKKKELTN